MLSIRCGFNDGPGIAGHELLVTHGPTLFVKIGFDPSFNEHSIGAPSLPDGVVHALVDTGATESCIDCDLADSLQLPIVDRRNIGGAGGLHEVNMYLAQIYVPALNFSVVGLFAGVHLKAGGQVHVALIGRTFLRNFVMTYEGHTGTVTISHAPAAPSTTA
jgi:predicted aspartyl protease